MLNGWYKVSCHADVKSEIVSTSAAARSACTIGCACTWMTCKFAHMITAPYRWPHPRYRASDISAKFPARLRRIIREINVASPSDKAQRRGRWCSSHLFGIIANFSRYYICMYISLNGIMMRELVSIGEWAAMIDEYNQVDVEKFERGWKCLNVKL